MNDGFFTDALARKVSRSLERCELLHLPRQPVDPDRAAEQHANYLAALESAGIRVTLLPEEPDLPDAAFVEDAVVVLDEVAVICRPAAASRQAEAERLAPVISKIRPTRKIVLPGTLEGGDVLRAGKTLFTAISTRTNREGVRQLAGIVSPFGYRVVAVAIEGCLHLKTAVTSPAEGRLVANPAWVDLTPFEGFEVFPVPPGEPWGANTLAVNGKIFVAASAPKTAELLESSGLVLQRVEITELQKAEAGLTCLSVLFRQSDR